MGGFFDTPLLTHISYNYALNPPPSYIFMVLASIFNIEISHKISLDAYFFLGSPLSLYKLLLRTPFLTYICNISVSPPYSLKWNSPYIFGERVSEVCPFKNTSDSTKDLFANSSLEPRIIHIEYPTISCFSFIWTVVFTLSPCSPP